MSEKTNIAWCDSTLNFWEGCTKVSAGCANCYAEARDRRFTGGAHWGKRAQRRKSKSAVKDALAFNRKSWICDHCGESYEQRDDAKLCCDFDKGHEATGSYHRRRILSLSLGDWLDPEIPIEWLAEMLDIIRQCGQVNWILCTKRPENWARLIRLAIESLYLDNPELKNWLLEWEKGNAPANIILLASVEGPDQAPRIDDLLRIPARWRGLSCEPLIGDVDLELQHGCRGCNHPGNIVVHWNQHGRCSRCDGTGHEPSGIHWLIIGGESGPKARPCNVEWIRSLAAQGKAAGVATFVKQLGALPFSERIGTDGRKLVDHYIALNDTKGGDPSEWPDDLRVQQWPEGL